MIKKHKHHRAGGVANDVPADAPEDHGHDSSDSEDEVEESRTRTVAHVSASERRKQFAKEVLELIGGNDVQQAHVLKVLRAVKVFYGPSLGPELVCPDSMYMLKKHAGYTPSKATGLIPVCALDHPNLAAASTCATPGCGADLHTRWPRRMVHLNIVERFGRLMSIPLVAEAFQYACSRTDVDGDIWDARSGRAISMPRRHDVAFLGLSTDGTEFGHTKSASLTPFVATVLNFPPAMRTTFSAVLLLALFPEKVTFYTIFTCILYHFNTHAHMYTLFSTADKIVRQPGDLRSAAPEAVPRGWRWICGVRCPSQESQTNVDVHNLATGGHAGPAASHGEQDGASICGRLCVL